MIQVDFYAASNRKKITVGWLIVWLIWSGIRSLVIGEVFSPHGVDINQYFLVDFFTTIPYAIFSARAVFAAIDKSSKFFLDATLAAVAFLLPDIYVFVMAKEVATAVWVEFTAYVILMSTLALIGAKSDRNKFRKS